MKNTTIKINKIILKHSVDYDSDLSYLGNFSNTAGKFAIAHDGGRNSYKYFNAENVENMKQAKENYDRMMQYEKGAVVDFGIMAEAEISTSEDGNIWTINHIKSGGLWGIESDSEESYIKQIEEEQLNDLKYILLQLGFTEDDINKAPIKHEEL